MYYGPLLGWAYVMGKTIKKEAQHVIPNMTFAGQDSDYIMMGTDGLTAVRALCNDFGLEVKQSVPEPLADGTSAGVSQERRECQQVSTVDDFDSQKSLRGHSMPVHRGD